MSFSGVLGFELLSVFSLANLHCPLLEIVLDILQLVPIHFLVGLPSVYATSPDVVIVVHRTILTHICSHVIGHHVPCIFPVAIQASCHPSGQHLPAGGQTPRRTVMVPGGGGSQKHNPFSDQLAFSPSAASHDCGTSLLSHSHTLQSRSMHMLSSGQKGQSQYRFTLKYRKKGVRTCSDADSFSCDSFEDRLFVQHMGETPRGA